MRESLALRGVSLPLTPSCSLWTNAGLPQDLCSSQLGYGVFLICLWSSLGCEHPPKHKAHIMGDPWYLATGSRSSHGEGQEEWLPWQQNRAHSPERQV